MDVSGDDLAPPDSWEMADLDASMSRLLVSAPSSKKSSASSLPAFSSPPELADEQGTAGLPVGLVESSFGGVERGGAASGDGFGQVDQFLREALEKPRERLAVLRMEQDILKFIRDPAQQQLELQPLPTSYLRLAAHRLAQHYYLQSSAIPDISSLDGSGSRILLRKTSYVCQMPPFRLADIPVNLPQEDNNVVPKVAIKQRPQKNSQNMGIGNAHSSKGNSQKSVEERKEEYNRARARIFNNSNSGGAVAKPDEVRLPDSLHDCSFVSAVSDDKSIVDGPANSLSRSYSDSSSGSSRSSKTKLEKETVISRQRSSNKVAIFRDREVDRKDPDYDRNYDRYMQRFDPGFGFSNGSYTMQPLYSPAVNYNTEFPMLGAGHRGPIPMDHQPRSIPQHLHGTWSTVSAPNAVNYGPPESMMGPFNTNHVGAPTTSSVYLHSSQYSVPSHPGISFVRPNEHVQHIAQSHHQQPEASFGLARPR